jgi:hypothetical protein
VLLLLLLPVLLPLCLQQCLPLDLHHQQLLSSALQRCIVHLAVGAACCCGGALEGGRGALKHKDGLHLVEQQPAGRGAAVQ